MPARRCTQAGSRGSAPARKRRLEPGGQLSLESFSPYKTQTPTGSGERESIFIVSSSRMGGFGATFCTFRDPGPEAGNFIKCPGRPCSGHAHAHGGHVVLMSLVAVPGPGERGAAVWAWSRGAAVAGARGLRPRCPSYQAGYLFRKGNRQQVPSQSRPGVHASSSEPYSRQSGGCGCCGSRIMGNLWRP